MVRNVMNKVVNDCCSKKPENKNEGLNLPKIGQPNESKKDYSNDKIMVNSDNAPCDVQTAFIDKSATNFINSVCSSSKIVENKIER